MGLAWAVWNQKKVGQGQDFVIVEVAPVYMGSRQPF
jgi:hypothetical protein